MKPSLALDGHREEIRRIVAANRGLNPCVFGSALRSEDRDESDLDLLIDPAEGMTLFDMAAMAAAIESLTHAKADVKTPEDLIDQVSQQGRRGSKAGMRAGKASRVQDCIEHRLRAIARIESYGQGLDLASFSRSPQRSGRGYPQFRNHRRSREQNSGRGSATSRPKNRRGPYFEFTLDNTFINCKTHWQGGRQPFRPRTNQ